MDFFVILLIGLVLLFAVSLYLSNLYAIRRFKACVIAAAVVLTGYVGSVIMYFIENGEFGGRSFFGGLFLLPPAMLLLARLLGESARDVWDVSAPCGTALLAVVKVHCLRIGCCRGAVIRYLGGNTYLRFPSQLCELCFGLILTAVAFLKLKNGKWRGVALPWCLYLYGIGRFVLDFFRDGDPIFWQVHIGSLWALLSAAIGIVWLARASKQKKTA